jgi:hypothetical protein
MASKMQKMQKPKPQANWLTLLIGVLIEGPYMGFEPLELMRVGHNWWVPEKPPVGQHQSVSSLCWMTTWA